MNHLFSDLVNSIRVILEGFLPGWVVSALLSTVGIAIVMGVMVVVVMSEVYLDRRVIARMQDRWGPNRVGPFGLLQPIADVIKLLLKEDLRPVSADPAVFFLAPLITVAAAFLVYSVIPFGEGMAVSDVNVGLLLLLALGALPTIGVVMAGWGSGNKYSVLGGMRAAAQMVSFAVPLLLALVSPILITHSLSMVDIVKSQALIPLVLVQPIAFVVYLIAGVAEVNRAPFDIPEAESELIAGHHIEYSGIRFALFFLAEYLSAFTVAAVATTVFLGGWQGPILPGFVWFFVKSYFVFGLMVWARATLPRLRADQLMGFCWKFLVPVALANLVVTAVGVSLWQSLVR